MNQVLKFLREVAAEFKNITWPKRDALINLTIVVISFSVVVSLILGGFDYLFTSSFNLLGQLKTQSAPPSGNTQDLQDFLSPDASPSAGSPLPTNLLPKITINLTPVPTKNN